MTTLAANKQRAYGLGEMEDYPMIAADIIYDGAAVGDNGSGYARPLIAGDPFYGFAQEKADNASGAAGDVNIRVKTKGYIQLSISGLAQADVGKAVYASDDDTFTLTASTNTKIGSVSKFISSGVGLIEFARTGALDAGVVTQLTDSSGGSASNTIAAATNTTALTDNNLGSAANAVVEDVADIALSTTNIYSDAAVNTAVNAAIAQASNNFKEMTATFSAQRTLNGVLINAIASLAAKVNELI